DEVVIGVRRRVLVEIALDVRGEAVTARGAGVDRGALHVQVVAGTLRDPAQLVRDVGGAALRVRAPGDQEGGGDGEREQPGAWLQGHDEGTFCSSRMGHLPPRSSGSAPPRAREERGRAKTLARGRYRAPPSGEPEVAAGARSRRCSSM